MTNESRIRPPLVASWLVSLFASAKDETLQGDLLEEFSQLASNSGASVAQRWYWRQTLQSVVHLFLSEFRAAPWSTVAIVVAGFFLSKILFPLPEKAIFAVIEKYRIFDHHFDLYVFFASDGIAISHVITSMLVGCSVALAARRKEMIATGALALMFCGMTAIASLVWIARGNTSMLWSILPWNFADWIAMLVGAAFIRSRRSASRTPTSPA
jgi:hypothetical protein